MKKVRIIASVLGISSLILFACQKEQSTSTDKSSPQLNVPAAVQKGQAIQVNLKNSPAGAVAKWTITPATGVTIDSSFSYGGNNITFEQAGNYEVTVTLKKVWCNPITAANPGMDTCFNSGTTSAIVKENITVHN